MTKLRRQAEREDEEKPCPLYWAYGMNLNFAQMRMRCPAAEPVMQPLVDEKGRRRRDARGRVILAPAKLYVPNGRLIFRGVADVEPLNDSKRYVAGGIWRITPECEEALDRLEGFPHFYHKAYLVLRLRDARTGEWGDPERCMFYKMCESGYKDTPEDRGISPPYLPYLDLIIDGYRDFGLDMSLLERAVRESDKEADKTIKLRQRWVRRGQPKLVRDFKDALKLNGKGRR